MTLLLQKTNSVTTFAAFAATVMAGLCLSVEVQAQQNGNSPSAIDLAEMKAALEVTQELVAREKAKAAAVEAKNAALVQSLAEANRVSEESVKAFRELQLKMEAFGVDLMKAGPQSLEKRMVKAVRDLDLAKQENEKLVKELHSLSETFVQYMGVTKQATQASRDLAEGSLQSANELLGLTMGPKIDASKRLKDGQIVSIDSEVGLIVLNVGRKSGVRIGMPLEVVRQDRSIGEAMIVDVRDAICGAVMQEVLVAGMDPAVGDKVRAKAIANPN